jgi:hypothetical protein
VIADLTNGAFELVGGVIIFANCRRILRDKLVRGVDWRVTMFFSVWGLWNLYYYPSLDQWASFAGGLAIVSANIVWVTLAIYYTRKEHYNDQR